MSNRLKCKPPRDFGLYASFETSWIAQLRKGQVIYNYHKIGPVPTSLLSRVSSCPSTWLCVLNFFVCALPPTNVTPIYTGALFDDEFNYPPRGLSGLIGFPALFNPADFLMNSIPSIADRHRHYHRHIVIYEVYSDRFINYSSSTLATELLSLVSLWIWKKVLIACIISIEISILFTPLPPSPNWNQRILQPTPNTSIRSGCSKIRCWTRPLTDYR